MYVVMCLCDLYVYVCRVCRVHLCKNDQDNAEARMISK